MLSPENRNTTDNAGTTLASRGSSYSATTSGVAAHASPVHTAPRAVLAQNRLLCSSRLRVGDWIAADDSPKSRMISATPITAATIATSPKSSGIRSRASTTMATSWSTKRTS